MKGRLVDLSFGRNRKQRVTIELDADFREKFDKLKDGDITVEVKKYRKKRSLNANSYAWVLMDKIAAELGVNRNEVYRNTIREIGGVSHIVCIINEAVDTFCSDWESKGLGWQTETMDSKIDGCTNIVAYKGSSRYNTKQMSQLIDSVVQDAQALGIETATPDELARMKNLWEAK
jgi:hypothetical protein